MALLGTDDILGSDDRKFVEIPVPEWGGSVRLRSLSGAERDRFETSMSKQRGSKREDNYENVRARLVALCAVDENGARLFTSPEKIAHLGTKSASALQKLFNACQALNGMSDQDVEELTEGFDETQSDSSDSA